MFVDCQKTEFSDSLIFRMRKEDVSTDLTLCSQLFSRPNDDRVTEVDLTQICRMMMHTQVESRNVAPRHNVLRSQTLFNLRV